MERYNRRGRGFGGRGTRGRGQGFTRPTVPGRGGATGRGGNQSDNRGRGQERSPNNQSGQGYVMGYRRLMQIRNDESKEMLQNIIQKKSGFPGLLASRGLSSDVVNLVLQILSRACECSSIPASKLKLLTEVVSSDFLKSELARYLTSLITETSLSSNSLKVRNSLRSCLGLLETLLISLPSSLPDVMVVFGSFEMCYRHFKGAGSIPISSDLEVNVARVRGLIDSGTKTKQKQIEKEENKAEDDDTPPDNFRDISTFPQMKDIHLVEEPFLRANKAKGGYKDLNHYLDVQYRLMREDFVAPLRNGIMEYIDVERRNERNHKYSDIKIYFGVSIMHPVCTRDGILHQIQFDNTNLKKVRWEVSKRLIYGSLLCLSRDSFRTLLFATVSDRSPAQLKKGIFYVKFEADHAQVAQISPDEQFVMAETSAYFEAYRHVLRGLQQVGNDMPFQQYIVNCDSVVQPPLYLRRVANIPFDLRPLVDKKSKFRNRRGPIRIFDDLLEQGGSSSDSDDDDQNPQIDEFDTASAFAAAIPILQKGRWPTATQLHLDPSQLKALKSALTNEFAVIQGPPGTGKTYVGLKIVKALLHNRSKWARGNNRPMLVVCYTNHALDQFLEGIQEFHDQGIIRVGGRSKSESLEKYMMKNVRRSKEAQNVIPTVVRRGLWDVRRALEEIETSMSSDIGRIKATECGIIGENLLEQFMLDHHYQQLFENPPQDFHIWRSPGKHTSILVEWLGLGNVMQGKEPEEILPAQVQQDLEEGEEELIAAEDEVDKIVEQRMLDEESDDDEDNWEGKTVAGLARPKGAAQIDSQIRMEMGGVVLTLDTFASETEEDESSEGWEVSAGEKRRRKKRMKKELRKTTMMSEEEAAAVANIWNLNPEQRWLLYRHWVSQYKHRIKDQMQVSERRYQMEQERLVEVKQQQDLSLMRRATVIGMTTTGAARYWRILQQVEPKIIIVEEAAEVLESHIVTTLSPGCEHLILIGDHKQLRPNPTVYQLAKRFNLDISLFERMVNNGMECNTLELQHRMRPEIAEIISPIYPDLRNHDSVLQYESILGVSGNLFFVDHIHEEMHNEETKSHSNHHEAQYTTALCKYLLQQGYRPDQITVLTTYSGQLFALRKLMPKAVFEGVRLCVVDNYQGEENDIILLSLVRSNKANRIGFLSIENRVCVALSRAKKGFFVIGNMTMLADTNDLWSDIVRILRRQGSVGPYLELYCRNHSENKIQAATARDFLRAPEGGCMEPCQFRLECGHVCEKACHVMDPEHKEYKCMKTCNKVTCEYRHKCTRRCHQECGECMKLVLKKIPICGHETWVTCHVPAEQWICKEPCSRILPCGHSCKEACGHTCTEKCESLVLKKWDPCGHVKTVPCQTDPRKSPCPRKCTDLLSCGHKCKGTCGKCRNGKLHQACSHPCKRTLVCGHECQEPCTKECPPCQQQCENRCVHSKCQGKCGNTCVPCKEPCQWQCQHQTCSMLCSEPCDREPCTEPCTRLLPCNHQCIGLCGEKCPFLCRVCKPGDVNEIFFGTEDEDDAKFVELEDCGHVLEVTGLDHWMNTESESSESITIQLKSCPKCKTPIRRNLRYGKLINAMLNDINNVKEKIFGSQLDIEDTKDRLRRETVKLERYDTKIAKKLDLQLKTKELHQEILEMYENQINMLQRLFKLRNDIKTQKLLIHGDTSTLLDDIEFMVEWCERPRVRFSQQEMSEAPLEISRISLLFKFILMYGKAMQIYKERKEHIGMVQTCISYLKTCTKLSEEKREEYIELFKKLKKELPDTGLGISEEEREMIVKAVGLAKGHWYKCPKGINDINYYSY